jgi:DNA adenine methylase
MNSIPYYGGKHNLLPELLKLIPQHFHYCEPFCGSAKLFFALPPAPAETLNDSNGKLITFYEVAKDPVESEKLLLLCEKTLHSESQFKRAKKILKNERGYTKAYIAWATWCILIQSHGAILASNSGWSFSYDNRPKQIAVSRISFHKRNIDQICKRLENVSLFCKDALKIIENADSKKTFFYIDPPYPEANQGHYKGYKMVDFLKLLDLVQKIEGKFLLSSGDYHELDKIAREQRWNQKKIKAISTAGKGSKKERDEVLTWNYDVQKKLF